MTEQYFEPEYTPDEPVMDAIYATDGEDRLVQVEVEDDVEDD